MPTINTPGTKYSTQRKSKSRQERAARSFRKRAAAAREALWMPFTPETETRIYEHPQFPYCGGRVNAVRTFLRELERMGYLEMRGSPKGRVYPPTHVRLHARYGGGFLQDIMNGRDGSVL